MKSEIIWNINKIIYFAYSRLRPWNLLLKNEIIDFFKIIFEIVYYIFKNIYDDIWFYRTYDVFQEGEFILYRHKTLPYEVNIL